MPRTTENKRVQYEWPVSFNMSASLFTEILKNSILKDRHNIPNALLIDKAIYDLNQLFYYQTSQASRWHNINVPAYNSMVEALLILQQNLPIVYTNITEFRSKNFTYPDSNPLPQNLDNLPANIEKLIGLSDSTLKMIAGFTAGKIEQALWHRVALDVADVFDQLMAPLKFGISHQGPKAKFVSAMVPYLTGERPNVGAVAKQLKEVRLRIPKNH